MTLKLILIRHCKSDWNNSLASDYERTLNDRGRADAPKIGAWLQTNGHVPDAVLCSDAARTMETWDLISGELTTVPDVAYIAQLYLAPPPVILRHIQQAQGKTIAIIAHNPGIAEFADHILSAPTNHPSFESYPTGATTVVTFDAKTWADIQLGAGAAIDFTVPGDL